MHWPFTSVPWHKQLVSPGARISSSSATVSAAKHATSHAGVTSACDRTCRSAATLLKWNGTAWAAQTSGTPNGLRGVWGADANNVWAVGYYGAILHKP